MVVPPSAQYFKSKRKNRVKVPPREKFARRRCGRDTHALKPMRHSGESRNPVARSAQELTTGPRLSPGCPPFLLLRSRIKRSRPEGRDGSLPESGSGCLALAPVTL